MPFLQFPQVNHSPHLSASPRTFFGTWRTSFQCAFCSIYAGEIRGDPLTAIAVNQLVTTGSFQAIKKPK